MSSPKNNKFDDFRINHKTKASKIKSGDLMAFVNWTKVKNVQNSGSTLMVTSLAEGSQDIKIDGLELIENGLSTDYYEEEVITSQSNIIDLLMQSYNKPFTVVFDKDDGTERVLRGRLIEPDYRRGRSKVEDLDKDNKDRFRLVDHRTIKSLIIEGTKYITK